MRMNYELFEVYTNVCGCATNFWRENMHTIGGGFTKYEL
jgi:hypothetical protein